MLSILAAVIGSGKWGSAITDVIAQNKPVFLYSRNKLKKSWHSNISVTNNIADVLNAKYLFIVIPAQAIKGFLEQIRGLSQDTVIILCAKGIDMSHGKLLSDIVGDIFPANRICVLSGPNFATEVMDKKLTISTIACNDINVTEEVARIFNTQYFKFIPNDDIISTQIFGALKNVLAIACGVARGLEMGENAVAAMFTQGISEIMYVIKKFGGDGNHIISSAGIGDIFLSCASATSRNNAFGILLAQGKKIDPDVVVEGKYTIIALLENYSELANDVPLLSVIYKIVTHKISGASDIQSNLYELFR